MIVLKDYSQIDKLREACRLTGECLKLIQDTASPGITTLDLDEIATTFAKDNGAIPAFKGYKGFPYSICASLNNEIVHGMPNNKPLQEGDILSVDYGVLLNGYYGDSAITIPIGQISENAEKIIKTGQECLYHGIKVFCEGARLNEISHAIQTHAESNGYGVIRNFVGHGIGKRLHEEPQLFNFTKHPKEGVEIKIGMVIAIEPMIVEGSYDIDTDKNKWTARTVDGGLAVHWEHTVAMIESGAEILSLREDENYDFSGE